MSVNWPTVTFGDKRDMSQVGRAKNGHEWASHKQATLKQTAMRLSRLLTAVVTLNHEGKTIRGCCQGLASPVTAVLFQQSVWQRRTRTCVQSISSKHAKLAQLRFDKPTSQLREVGLTCFTATVSDRTLRCCS